MSNTIDNIFAYKKQHKPGCRIAYTLNNNQPVKCSIVSDQPLFYMDFEDEIEEEDFGEVFDFTAIEEGVENIKARIEGLSRDNFKIAENSQEERFSLFLDTGIKITDEKVSGASPDIKFLEKTLRQSRLAEALLQFAFEYDSKLDYDPQIETAVYDRKSGNILINPNLGREEQILLVTRELRRIWQHRHGALLNPLTFNPDQAILINRAQIADLAVIMTRVAWELQLSGDKAIWERMESSSMADLARAFARESYLDFRTLNNGVAQSAVFESWFLSERCRNEDKNLIQQMLADYHGYVFDNAQSSQHITAELIVALGTMPFGKNYLAPYVNTIMNDAIFTEVRDRSNANFLWFIKFERSFREAEQELQTDYDISGQENNSGPKNQKNKRFGDYEKESEIIVLPRGGQGAASSQEEKARGNEKKRAAGNIIQFQQRSGDV